MAHSTWPRYQWSLVYISTSRVAAVSAKKRCNVGNGNEGSGIAESCGSGSESGTGSCANSCCFSRLGSPIYLCEVSELVTRTGGQKNTHTGRKKKQKKKSKDPPGSFRFKGNLSNYMEK